jgi:hypothetical protein
LRKRARPRGAYQQYVALFQLDVVGGRGGEDPQIVVVHGDGERALGPLLADDVLVEDSLYLRRLRELLPARRIFVLGLTFEYIVAQLHALAADVHGRSGHEAGHFLLTPAAEGAPYGMR